MMVEAPSQRYLIHQLLARDDWLKGDKEVEVKLDVEINVKSVR